VAGDIVGSLGPAGQAAQQVLGGADQDAADPIDLLEHPQDTAAWQNYVGPAAQLGEDAAGQAAGTATGAAQGEASWVVQHTGGAPQTAQYVVDMGTDPAFVGDVLSWAGQQPAQLADAAAQWAEAVLGILPR
jgi:hypothetical protein